MSLWDTCHCKSTGEDYVMDVRDHLLSMAVDDEIKLIGNLSKVVTERFALLTAGRDTAQQLAASRIHYRRHKIHDSSRASWHIASYV